MKTIFLCLIFAASAFAGLPSYIQTCSRNDSDFGKCFTEKGNAVIKILAKGDKQLKLKPIAPSLKHPGIVYYNDEFYFQIKNVILNGLDSFTILETQANFQNRTISMKFKINKIDCGGLYVAKALKEKDQVSSTFTADFTDNHYQMNIEFDIKENRIAIANMTVESYGEKTFVFHFADIDTHEAVKKVWNKYATDFFDSGTKAMEGLLIRIIGQVFESVTYDEIFPPMK